MGNARSTLRENFWVHTLSCTLRVSATGTRSSRAQLVGSYRTRIHAPVSVRYRYRTGQLIVHADAGGRQHAAHSARHALYCIALSQILRTQWECARSTLRVEIGPQWELSVYLLRLPRYRLTTPQSDCVTRGVSDQNAIHLIAQQQNPRKN